MHGFEAAAFAGAVGGLVAAVSRREPDKERTFFRDCLGSGSANVIASSAVHPLDVSKTRMQVQVRLRGSGHGGVSLLRTVRGVLAEGGVLSLVLPGLTASMLREMVGGSIRGGLYIPIRNALGGEANGSWLGKAGAALASGCIGSVVANPIEIVKVRLLADGSRYSSTFGAFPEVVKAEGWSGLARGLVPSVSRGGFVNVGYLATYDHAKHTLLWLFHGSDSPKYHVAASLLSGVVATTLAAPFDMLKTRVMVCGSASAVRVLTEVLSAEGPHSLFRGWLPAYLRLGPHSLLCFPLQEELRKLLGLGYL